MEEWEVSNPVRPGCAWPRDTAGSLGCVTFAPGGFRRPPKEAAHNGFVLPVSGRISVSQETRKPNKEGGRSVVPGLRPLPPAYELVWQRV